MSGSSTNRDVKIRPATAADYDALVAVWEAAGQPYHDCGRESRAAFTKQLDALGSMYLVAAVRAEAMSDEGQAPTTGASAAEEQPTPASASGETLVGVALGSHDQRKGWINRLAVHPDYQRRGVAQRLVEACEKAIRAEGIEIVGALIEEGNHRSRAFFESLGYRNDIPALYYRKPFRPDI
jgi:ribosomal protein S18 acetylase RimI-like enzyme